MNENKSRRSSRLSSFLFRFGIRTILALTAVVGVAFAYWNYKFVPLKKALDQLEQAGCEIYTDSESGRELTRVEKIVFDWMDIQTNPYSVFGVDDELGLLAHVEPLRQFPILTYFYSGSAEINDLEPIAHLTAMLELRLPGCNVRDLEPLRHLTQLEILDLTGNPVQSIEPIGKLKQLLSLELGETRVFDVSALKDLKALGSLSLRETDVSDILALSDLIHLSELDLSETNVTDISALSNLKEILDLNLAGTAVSEVVSISQSHKIERLNLSGTSVSDISALEKMSKLESVNLAFTKVENISALAGRVPSEYESVDDETGQRILLVDPGIIELDIRGSRVSDLDPIAGMTGIDELDLTDTEVSDLSPLENLPDLASLKLVGCPLHHFGELTTVEDITLGGLRLTSLEGLEKLTNIDSLTLENCEIRDLSPIGKLPRLRDLDLANLSTAKLPDFQSPILYFLHVNNACLAGLAPLERLTTLRVLEIRADQAIEDWSFLTRLQSNKHLRSLAIRNPSHLDLGFLIRLKSLKSLEIIDCELSGIEHVTDCTNITFLCLSSPSVKDIQWAGKLEKLSWLLLPRASLSNIEPLAECSNLEVVNLEGTLVSDVSPLTSNAKTLKYLWLKNTPVIALPRFEKLRMLNIADTGFTDLAPLTKLNDIQALDVSGLAITRQHIELFATMPNLTELNLSHTGLADASALNVLTELDLLTIEGLEFNGQQLAKLRASLPKCEIETVTDSHRRRLLWDGITKPTDGTVE